VSVPNEIRSILLHLDARPGSASRLAVAHALADRHGAELTALFGVRPSPAQASFAYSASAALQAVAERIAPREGERERLMALAATGERECVWCDVVGDTIVHGFVAEAAYADLLIVGAPTDGDDGGPPHGFVEAVVLQSAAPALVVPHPLRRETVGERAFVAWNGSVQAARALKAALPLLQRAAEVHGRELVGADAGGPVQRPRRRPLAAPSRHRRADFDACAGVARRKRAARRGRAAPLRPRRHGLLWAQQDPRAGVRRCHAGAARAASGAGADGALSPPPLRQPRLPLIRARRISRSIAALTIDAGAGASRKASMHNAIPAVAGVPVEFVLFAAVLAGVALLHHHSLRVALIGVATITLYKVAFSSFHGGTGVAGFAAHLASEWVLLVNLLLLIVGFALLARHFEESRVPILLPALLPDDWKGGFALLVIVFVLSSFLDNIAAAMIGGAMAHALYRGRVHVGYLAAIVAASNGGGSGSVVGDTTTTMMWIDGVKPLQVLEAYVAAIPALVFFGILAARQQHALQPIMRDAPAGVRVDRGRIAVVVAVLVTAIVVNVVAQLSHGSVPRPPACDRARRLAGAARLRSARSARLARAAVGDARRRLSGEPRAVGVDDAGRRRCRPRRGRSRSARLRLGVFDNIPLTALALRQGGYDWGFLAYAVGFGGSMVWFGSSAGVALASQFAEARSARRGWSRAGTSRSPTCSALRSSSSSSAGTRSGALGRTAARIRCGQPIPQSQHLFSSRRHRRVGRIRRGNWLAPEWRLGKRVPKIRTTAPDWEWRRTTGRIPAQLRTAAAPGRAASAARRTQGRDRSRFEGWFRVPHALLVDDDSDAAETMAMLIANEGFTVATAGSLQDARRQMALQEPDIVLLDLMLPDGSGMELFHDAKQLPNTELVLITGHASLETSIQALRLGAADYLVKPMSLKQLKGVLSRVTRPSTLKAAAGDMQSVLDEEGHFGELWGRSQTMRKVYQQIVRVAGTNVSVFITGESGTGKEVVARTLHDLSRRRSQPFLGVNCGAISPHLMESEIFGHEKGSFTGADRQHLGFFERTNGGTLLLDEITEMPLDLQVKLLRVLETGTFMRVGSTQVQETDVRIVAATNRNPCRGRRQGKAARGSALSPQRLSDPPAAAARPRRGHSADRRAFPRADRRARGRRQEARRRRPRALRHVPLAGQCPRAAQRRLPRLRHDAGADDPRRRAARVGRRGVGERRSADGDVARRHDARRGRPVADARDARAPRPPQGEDGGHARHQPEDALQPAEGIRRRGRRAALRAGHARRGPLTAPQAATVPGYERSRLASPAALSGLTKNASKPASSARC
jgi:CheY-like chemotaxis protein